MNKAAIVTGASSAPAGLSDMSMVSSGAKLRRCASLATIPVLLIGNKYDADSDYRRSIDEATRLIDQLPQLEIPKMRTVGNIHKLARCVGVHCMAVDELDCTGGRCASLWDGKQWCPNHVCTFLDCTGGRYNSLVPTTCLLFKREGTG